MSPYVHFILFFVTGILFGVRYIVIGWKNFKHKNVHLAIEESFINRLYSLLFPQQVAKYIQNLKYQFVGIRSLFFGFVFTLLSVLGMILSLSPKYHFAGVQYLFLGLVFTLLAIPGMLFSLLEVITTYTSHKKPGLHR